MRIANSRLLPLALVAGWAGAAQAQDLPTSQPRYLHIVREQVKVGRAADHAKFEAGWPAALEKAKSPDFYLAMVAVTGAREAWYIRPLQSWAAFDEGMKRDDADPILSAELERLSRGDAEFLTDLRVMQAEARPDLSHGPFPDLAKMRFWEITVFNVRPGHDAEFAAVAKAYAAAAARSAPMASWRTYQVVAGAPGPSYIVFSSVASFGEFDRMATEGEAIMKAFTSTEMALMEKFSLEGLAGVETNRFRLDPAQSYVAQATRAQDPAFWISKRTAAKKTATKKSPAQP